MDAQERKQQIYRVTIVGSIGNMLLTAFKFVAGWLGHSSAMIADAVHSLSDLITDVVVLVFVRISSKPSDQEHRYGHGKYETLATVVISLLLLGVGVGIFWHAARDIWHWAHGGELVSPGIIALIAALLSIVIKEGLYHYTARASRRLDSSVVMANAWHHRSDALSSIGTAVGIGGAILLGARWRVLDPLAAAVVSVFIVRVAIQLMRPALDELVERSLPPEVEQQILDAITSFPEAVEPHNLRTRRIGTNAAVDVHVRMDGGMTVEQSHAVTRLIERRIKDLLGQGAYVSIHVEPKHSTPTPKP